MVAQSSVNHSEHFPELIEQMLLSLFAAEDNDVSTNEHDLFGRAIGLVSLLHQRQCIIGAWRLKSGTNYTTSEACPSTDNRTSIEYDQER